MAGVLGPFTSIPMGAPPNKVKGYLNHPSWIFFDQMHDPLMPSNLRRHMGIGKGDHIAKSLLASRLLRRHESSGGTVTQKSHFATSVSVQSTCVHFSKHPH